MRFWIALLRKTHTTDLALIWFFSCMDPKVNLTLLFRNKSFVTESTNIRLFPSIIHLVSDQVFFSTKFLWTMRTSERWFTSVNSLMFEHIGFFRELLTAYFTTKLMRIYYLLKKIKIFNFLYKTRNFLLTILCHIYILVLEFWN